MFIEPLLTTSRAPAERNVSGDGWKIEHVSLLWSDEGPLGSRAFYKHFVPLGRGIRPETLSENQDVYELATQSPPSVHREGKSLANENSV